MPPGATADTSVASAVLVDAHAHFWEAYDQDRFLDAADRNLTAAASRVEAHERPARALLVMETEGRRLFEAASRPGRWQLHPTSEEGSVRAVPTDAEAGDALLLIEGRQVVTAEGLELLAAPCRFGLPTGRRLDETVAAAREGGAVPMLPWGFGKWWGRRGRLVASALESHRPPELLVVDNGGRPRRGPKPRLLTLAAQRGFPVLGGSDPLPFAADQERAGSFGSVLRGELDPERPAADLHQLLRGLEAQPRLFGGGVGVGVFFANQLRLRLRRVAR